jgi:hypothetical protein
MLMSLEAEVFELSLRTTLMMSDINDDAKGGLPRFQILTGPGRRRQQSP